MEQLVPWEELAGRIAPVYPKPGRGRRPYLESVDEFYSENLAQEVTRGMREAASRGFWVSTYAPYGYKKIQIADGAKKRPRLALNPPADAMVRRIST